MKPGSSPDAGAYGLRLVGLVPAQTDLVERTGPTWQTWTTVYEESAGRPVGDWDDVLDGERATLALGSGIAAIDRAERRTVLRFPAPPSAAELTHPYLSATAAVAAHWRGDVPLHAGGFVADGRVWGVLGDREAGKSTTMAAIWQAGLPVFTDDLLVLRGRTALAGPRCIDLRQPTADWLGAGDYLGVVGLRERWRIALDQVAPELPLGGFVLLDWATDPAAMKLPTRDAVRELMAARGVLSPPADPSVLLEVFTAPVWRLSRPRRLDLLPSIVELLVRTVTA